MNTPKPRKACTICYQKKIRCNWSENAPVCSYCIKHGLECLLPDPTQPAPRLAVRDKLAEFDARLQRLENESRSTRRNSEGSMIETRFPSTEALPPVSAAWDWEGSFADFAPDSRPNRTGGRALSTARASGDSSAAILAAHDISGVALPDAPDDLVSQYQLGAASIPVLNTSEEERSVRRFRGETSTWEVLADGAAAVVPSLANGQFSETINRLSEEERSTKPVVGNVEYDLLKEFPELSAEDIRKHTQHYRREAPFPIVYWPSLEVAIEQGLETKRWAHWGEVVCVLLYVSFGSVHLKISGPQYDSEVYFQKAWNMLPQLLFEQDLWALKGLTLMARALVHYLQGGSLPEPCYTLLGSASRVAISLGFHRRQYDKAYTAVEEEQGKRCWWLCYILEKTFSLILGRPSTNLEMYDAEIPRPFSTPSASGYTLRDGVFSADSDINDEEAVDLFADLIEVLRNREEILRSSPARGKDSSLQPRFDSNYENVAELLLHWRAASKLKRPLDFNTTNKGSLRATICDLAYYNTVISLDRQWKRDFETSMAVETVQSARATIMLISEFHTDGMTMCLWMWLYYAFTAAVVLFLDVINNPLHAEATLNVALISDIEAVCTGFSPFSPGAKRVMEVSKEMNKVAFELIKSRAKRKAKDDLTAGNVGSKQQRVTGPGSGVGAADPGAGESDQQIPEDFAMNTFPANFSWDDWDQWLNDTSL